MDPQQRSIAREFDSYNETYNDAVSRAISFSGQSADAFTKAKAEDLIATLSSHFGSSMDLSVLDVGCGIGNFHPILAPAVRLLSGVDISEACIEKARERNPTVLYQAYEGGRLPFPDGHFDVTFCVCVLHHVPPERWSAFTQELRRVTRDGGLVVVYEHNPSHPLTRRVVRDCEFDHDAVLLHMKQTRRLLQAAGCMKVSVKSILTLPPWGGAISSIDRLLANLPFGTQYRAIGHVEGSEQRP